MDGKELYTYEIKCYDCKKIFDRELLGTEGHDYFGCEGCGEGLCSSCVFRHCDYCPDLYCRSCFESGNSYYCTRCGDEEDRIE